MGFKFLGRVGSATIYLGGQEENLARGAIASADGALNFLDLFASFLGQAKNEEVTKYKS